MIDHRAFAGHDFGDGVGEVPAGARVSLDDGALRVGADQDERARVDRRRKRLAGHIVCDFDRLLDHRAARHAQHRHVVQESGVQRHERVLIEAGVARQVSSDLLRIHLFDAGRPYLNLCRARPEAGPRDRRHVGEAPLFVVRGGEAQLREPLRTPPRAAPEATALPRLACVNSASHVADLFRYGRHTLPTASSSSSNTQRRRSRSLPAPAPVPCRPISRSGLRTARARNPARCSSAAAGSASPRSWSAPGCAARSRRPPPVCSASISRPESVSSRIASRGSSTAIWKISLRFFSPPEKPVFTGRFSSAWSISISFIFSRTRFRKSMASSSSRPLVLADGVERGLQEVHVADAGDLHRVLKRQEDAFARAVFGRHRQQVLAVVESPGRRSPRTVRGPPAPAPACSCRSRSAP